MKRSTKKKREPGSQQRVVSKPPNRIYLQWVGDGDRLDADKVDESDVTWASDRVFRQDYVYVRLRGPKRKAC